MAIDWSAGRYEPTAVELSPVAERIVAAARIRPGLDVLDLGCGTGNAALLAAAQGARAVGVDAAPRLLKIARHRAAEQHLEVDFRDGDLLALPVADASADLALSVFGVIFAADPQLALAEIARVLRAGGRALITAWVPAGPMFEMLQARLAVMQRAGENRPGPPPVRWSDAQTVARLATAAGLELALTTRDALAIAGESPEAYVLAGREHPMALAMLPRLRELGVEQEAIDAAVAVMRAANEDPRGFLVHSPYVVHELRR